MAAGIAERRMLIGREAELDVLHRALDDLGDGIGGAVLVAGDAGIGKTALLAELPACRVERGYRTPSAGAGELESDVPLAIPGAAAGDRPLVLALDDLHWADAASIGVVCRMLHRGVGRDTLLVLGARPAEAPERLLVAVDEARRARRVELGPLADADARQILGDDVDPDVRDAAVRESGGNPFRLEQLACGRTDLRRTLD